MEKIFLQNSRAACSTGTGKVIKE